VRSYEYTMRGLLRASRMRREEEPVRLPLRQDWRVRYHPNGTIGDERMGLNRKIAPAPLGCDSCVILDAPKRRSPTPLGSGVCFLLECVIRLAPPATLPTSRFHWS
jgi:hypothetical protein